MITNFKIFEYVDSKDVGSAYNAFLSIVNKNRLVAWISDFDEDLDLDYQMKKYPYLKKIQLFEKVLKIDFNYL